MRNRVIVVTGASTGIGQAIATEFAKEKAILFLIARTKDKLEKTKKQVEKNSGIAEVIIGDLSINESVNKIIETIKSKTKKVDVLVNVAGIWHGKDEVYAGKDFETFSQQVILDTYNVGLVAPTLLSHGLIPIMSKGAKIINISGTFESGSRGWLPYYVSKKGIEDLTVGLSEELERKGIQVNAVSPSDTATEAYKHYFPLYIQEAIEPTEVAKQVVYLCSDKASNITGGIFVVKKGKETHEGFHT